MDAQSNTYPKLRTRLRHLVEEARKKWCKSQPCLLQPSSSCSQQRKRRWWEVSRLAQLERFTTTVSNFLPSRQKWFFFADCLHLAPVWRHIRLRRRHCNHTWKLSWICAEEQCGDNWAWWLLPSKMIFFLQRSTKKSLQHFGEFRCPYLASTSATLLTLVKSLVTAMLQYSSMRCLLMTKGTGLTTTVMPTMLEELDVQSMTLWWVEQPSLCFLWYQWKKSQDW